MLKCAGCNSEYHAAPPSGICQKCGDLVVLPGALTADDIMGTIELPTHAAPQPPAKAGGPKAPPRKVPARKAGPKPAAAGHDTAATIEFTKYQGEAGDQTAATIELRKEGAAEPPGHDTAATIEFTKYQDEDGGQTAATIELPRPGGDDPKNYDTAATVALPGAGKRSVQIAPRKLSLANMKLITGTWEGTFGDATPRTSLKLDSKTASGMGSSLVVNPRGVRNAHLPAPATSGADYELLEVIGKGGMGVVYSARQASVDRLVAVKMIRPNAALDAERREKFLSEAVVTGDLDHPNIVPIYELGTNEQNALFYSMKRVQGTPWSQALATKTQAANIEVLMKVADAVAFAHANGVVHRDLKPDNVMLGDYGEVLVMDWGLALATASFRHSEFVTDRPSMGGTPAYMAPEMVTGPFELMGPSCDIYLLGALLFEVVTGHVPHQGNTAQECLMAAARNEIRAVDVTGELVDVAYRAMATDPKDRYPTVQDFQAALRAYQSHCDSVLLTTRADQELGQARKTGNYEGYAHALFAFQEALAMWDGNPRAKGGIAEAKLAYAECAKQKGDFELGISLLDPENLDHANLRGQLEALHNEREARHKWLTRFKRIAAAMALLVFGVITASLFVVAQAKNRESAAKDQAILDKQAAEVAEQDAQRARQQEMEQKNIAIAAEKKANDERVLARAAEAKALEAEQEERKQKVIAKQEEQKAVAAKRGEEYAAYVARIGMAAAKIDENAFDTAASLLAACRPTGGDEDLRNWEWGYLERLRRQGFDFPAQGMVSSVAFAPDGKWFVTAGEDGQAHLWDPATGKLVRDIDHGSPIMSVVVSPDGKLVATAGADGQVRISSAADGKLLHTLAGHEDRVLGAAFSPGDGHWLATASRDRTVRIWDTTTGREIGASPLRGHSWWVWSAAFSQDGKQLITAGHDGKAIVWSFEAGAGEPRIAQQKVFLGHDGPLFAAAFSPDGRLAASAGYDKRVLVWNPGVIGDIDFKQLVSNEPLAQQKFRAFEGHSAPIRSVAFSVDGQFVLSGGDDNTVRIWETSTGRQHALLRGHSRPVQSCAFSPDGRRVVSVGQEGQIKLWNILDYREMRAVHGRVLGGHEDAILAAAFSRDGSHIVTASRDHTARIFEAATGKPLRVLREGHEFLTSRAIYCNGDKWLLTAAGDNSVRIWDAARGTQLCSLDGTGRNAAVAVSRDAKWVLTGMSDTSALPSGARPNAAAAPDAEPARRRLLLWKLDDAGTSGQLQVLANQQFGTGHRATVTSVAISPDGRLLFSGDDTGLGKLWDAATGAELKTLKAHTRSINDAEFTPDGRRLLTASDDGTVAQWDVATGEELRQKLSHLNPQHSDAYDAPVKHVKASPDGRFVLTLSEDTKNNTLESVVRLWDADAARVTVELYRGPQGISSIAFADAGQAVLAAGSERLIDAGGAETEHSFVRRWEVPSGREMRAGGDKPYLDFTGRQESVWAAVEAPHGEGVLTVGGNGASLWNPASLDQPERVFKPHSGVTSVGFSADGRLVVTASTDRRAKIWNAETGACQLQLPPAHGGALATATFSPVDARLLLTAGGDGTARIWELPAGKVVHVLGQSAPGARAVPLRAAQFSPDGTQVLTAGDDGVIRLWESTTAKQALEIKAGAPVLAAAYSPDGKRIIAGAANGRAMIFDAVSGQLLVRYLGHTAAVNAVAISPDGRRAVTGSSDRTAKVWDTEIPGGGAPSGSDVPAQAAEAAAARDGREILTLKHHDQAVTAVAFAPDGRAVLTAGLDGTAVVALSDEWQAAKQAAK